MFSTFLEKLSSFFDKHWLLRYFFPSLAFWGAGLAVYGAALGVTEPIDLWHRQPAEVQLILLAGALIWLTLFAYLLANFGTALIRLLEGYWENPPLKWLRRSRQAYYEKRFLYLEAELDQITTKNNPHERQRLEREWLLLFPQGRDEEKALMPTRLGNIIKAAETYPLETYGADAVILWPRLVPFLPAEFAEAFNAAQTAMEIMLVLSILSFVFATVSCTLLAFLTLDLGLFVICTVGFPLARIFYNNSLHGALGYAELIKTAFDLHRSKLLDALGLEKPTNLEEERKIWNDVSQLFLRNTSFLTARFAGALVPRPEPSPRTWLGRALDEVLTLASSGFPNTQPPASSMATTATPQIPPLSPVPPASLREPSDRFPFFYFGLLLILCLVGAGSMALRSRHPVRNVVLARDVPAYRLLARDDLNQEKPPRAEVPEDLLPEFFDVFRNAYLTRPLPKGTLLKKSDVRRAEPSLLEGRVAFGISATPAMVLGGALKPGDVVELAIAPAKDALPWDAACDPRSLRRLLALDVKAPEKQGSPYVVVLAVPPGCQATLTGAASRISLARSL